MPRKVTRKGESDPARRNVACSRERRPENVRAALRATNTGSHCGTRRGEEPCTFISRTDATQGSPPQRIRRRLQDPVYRPKGRRWGPASRRSRSWYASRRRTAAAPASPQAVRALPWGPPGGPCETRARLREGRRVQRRSARPSPQHRSTARRRGHVSRRRSPCYWTRHRRRKRGNRTSHRAGDLRG